MLRPRAPRGEALSIGSEVPRRIPSFSASFLPVLRRSARLNWQGPRWCRSGPRWHLPDLEALGNIWAERRLSVGRDMHKADTQGRTGSSPMARSGPSPFVAFAVAAVLALAGLGVWFLAAQGEAPKPAPAPEIEGAPAVVLTEAEAKAEFERLTHLRFEAYEKVDVSLLPAFLAEDSPLNVVIRREIRRLERSGIVPLIKSTDVSVTVRSLTKNQIRIRQVVEQEIRFINSAGKDITKNPGVRRRTIDWVLVQDDTGWRVLDSQLIRERKLD